MNDNPPPYGFNNSDFQGKGGQQYPAQMPPPSYPIVSPQSIPQHVVNLPGPTTTTVVVSPTQTVVVGGCPACRIGTLMDEFTCMGIFCCILFFPLGLICLFCMQEKRCAHCQAKF